MYQATLTTKTTQQHIYYFDTRHLPSNSLVITLIARFMGPTWGPSGADRTQVGPMWALWTLLSGKRAIMVFPVAWELCPKCPILSKFHCKLYYQWMVGLVSINRPILQIPECTCPISHNAPFWTEMCTLLFLHSTLLGVRQAHCEFCEFGCVPLKGWKG